jgi:hypothetical protein
MKSAAAQAISHCYAYSIIIHANASNIAVVGCSSISGRAE